MNTPISPNAAPPPVRATFDWLFVVAALLVIATFIRAIYFTPIEALQGPAQKIYYVHPPSAWVAFLAFGVVAVASIGYLWMKDLRLDRLAESSAEVGVVFTTITLMTGSLWGKPIWGTWWTWDARLTSTLFLWFIYVGYLILRGAIEDPGMRARYSAVLGILGSLLIPFIHLSVYLFRTLHPMPIIGKPSKPSLPNDMLETFLMAFFSFTVLYVALLRARYRLATDRAALETEEAR
ncbi:MAG TPA: cytochrome c biogenesis protein CcsA [Gemmatimonadaceae bacterium]|nr:cytochrome c biogenesis protein CcsA [Gemmatimonadaceae bacterium]